MILHLYFYKIFFRYLFYTSAGLLSIFSFLAFSDALENVGKGDFLGIDAFFFTLLTIPSRAAELIPACTLISAMLTMGHLKKTSELIIFSSAGFSDVSIFKLLLALSALLSIIFFILFELAIPVCEKKSLILKSKTFEEAAIGKNQMWIRKNNTLLRVGNLDNVYNPKLIEIYELDADNAIQKITIAESAIVSNNNEWALSNAKVISIGESGIEKSGKAKYKWKSFITLEQYLRLISPPSTLSLSSLYTHLSKDQNIDIDFKEYSLLFWKRLLLPVNLISMLVLGLTLSRFSSSSRSVGFQSALGGIFAITFYIFDQIFTQINLMATSPQPIVAIIPSFLIIITSWYLTSFKKII